MKSKILIIAIMANGILFAQNQDSYNTDGNTLGNNAKLGATNNNGF